MSNIDNQLKDIRWKIATVKENRENRFQNPRHILAILSLREMALEDNLFFLKQKTSF